MVTDRKGQALLELAVGMFTLTLLVSALVAFAIYIVGSLKAQNLNRGDPPKFKESIPLLNVGHERTGD